MLPDRFLQSPLPGDIWELGFDTNVIGFAAIVHEANAAGQLTVMLFSGDTDYRNEVNLLLPAAISGLERDVLAETWNVGTIAIDCLQHRIGRRLSRPIYDLLLSIGDVHHGLSSEMPDRSTFQALELSQGASLLEREALDEFYHQERARLQCLHPSRMAQMADLVEGAIALEREFVVVAARISLSRWLQKHPEKEWCDVSKLNPVRKMAVRHLMSVENVAKTVADLSTADSVASYRQSIKQLGLAIGNGAAQQALVEIVKTTVDDETLWTAIDSLQRMAPDCSVGVRRLKQLDLGVNLDLVVSAVERADSFACATGDRKISIRLQVCPDRSADYLPIDLKLSLQDNNEQELWQIVAGPGDYCIQMKLNGLLGEEFGVLVQLGDRQAIEKFVI
jgi:hypothetical protein